MAIDKNFIMGYGAGKASKTSQTIIEETDAWLEENISQETGYVLDRTLSMENAAAPADLVGDLKSALAEEIETQTDVLADEWSVGLMTPQGVPATSLTSYRYSSAISVQKGDRVYLKKHNGANIATVERVCAYEGETAKAASGAGDTFTLPYIVEGEIDGVIFSTLGSYFADGNPYYVIVRSEIVPKLTDRVANLEVETADLENRVSSLERKEEIEATWTDGYYVNNVSKNLTALNGFSYTNLIELKKGESIQVFDGYTTTATVVDMISEWDSTGNTYVTSIYPYSAANQYSDSTKYVATNDTEYIRVCTMTGKKADIVINKYGVQFSETIVEEVNDVINSTILPTVSMFERIGFCGDSYVKGQIWRGTGDVIGDKPDLSWGSDIGKMYGITADIFASSGADTNTFQSREDCLPALLASQNPCGLYVFCLGINDSTYVTTGTIDDITDYEDWHDYPNTFYGNYGKIIEQILEYSPNSKIILMTPYNPNYNATYLTPVTEISEHYGIAMIDTTESLLCNGGDFASLCVGAHPTVALHSAMGRDIANLIAKCISNNYTYFKTYYGMN